MERYRKKDMLQTVDTLLKANDAVLKTSLSNPQGASEALVQCQESAIILGTHIDTLGETYAHLVHLLEDYCENIYRMSESLSDENACRKTAKKIQKQLTSLQNGIKYDMPEDKKEVVFLPYKASMWDSLESVWKAADADENTDAYVIPIPYFDKNPDGSFREEHYEGNQYPKNVPITRYDEYDLEARRPDVIYIHNPYDEHNHVTSVHPYFYSTNLKNYTDKLVYIPYFVLGEIEPDNQAAINSMKHFCFVPGTIYADQVIVQSENMRQIYINEYIKAAKGMGLGGEHVDRKFLEKKFLGTGSPKFDKIMNTKKEDLEIPADWLKIIEKPDGSWKKIVFYNVSVNALLHDEYQLLRKIESVFEFLKENQDKMVLLWRPHPLIQATIESMRPQLWEMYNEIKEKYIEEGWGIYDDTSDVDRAVILSDMYYGDRSSVIQMCQKAEKPVMIQNANSVKENNYSLAMDNIVEYRGEWWFFAFKDNGIYRMDKELFEAKLEIRIPWDESLPTTMPQYGKLYSFQDKFFIIPWMPVKIAVYDLKKQQLRYIDYERENEFRGTVFCEGIVKGTKLYLIPCTYENMLCIDMEAESVTYIRLGNVLKGNGQMYPHAWGSVFFDEEMVYATMLLENQIICYNVQTHSASLYQSELLADGCAGICGNENDIWIIPRKTNCIIHWDRKQKRENILADFPEGYSSGDWSFHKMLLFDKYLYLLPRTANMCIVVDIQTNEINCVNWNEKRIYTKAFYDTYMRYSHVWEDKENIYLISSSTGDIGLIDKAEGKTVQRVLRTKIIDLKGKEDLEAYHMQELENRFENIENYLEKIL